MPRSSPHLRPDDGIGTVLDMSHLQVLNGTSTRLPQWHHAAVIDRAAAARRMADSVNGTGPHWDAHVEEHRPHIALESTIYAAEILGAVQEDLTHLIPCTYEGDDVEHPDARAAILAWAELRAGEKADELAALPIAEDGTIAVDRLIGAEPADLRTPLGVFWTTDIDHGGLSNPPWDHVEGRHVFLFSARVHHSDVDWQTSCVARMDWYSGDHEKELRLLPGRRLRNVSARRWSDTMIDRLHLPLVLPDADWTT